MGLYLTIGTGFFQIRRFGTVLKKTVGEVFQKENESTRGEGQLKPYQALSTVLAGTVGSGNIAGVAAAIAIGGPGALKMIFQYAFAPMPAVGGFAGSTMALAMGRGASRGIFSNEAGEGTAATVHATAQTDHPIHQGMYGVLEVFIDTIIICTLTALSIITSGVWSSGSTGAVLTLEAFRTVWGKWGTYILCIAIILFTYSSYQGFFVEYRTSTEYLFGEKAIKYLQWFFFVPPIIAVTMPIEAIWSLADMAVGFIVIPNMLAILLLSKKFFQLFQENMDKKKK